MAIFEGLCASKGLADGRLHVVRSQSITEQDLDVSDPAAEKARLLAAFADVERQINGDANAARSRGEAEAAEVFEAHAVMLTDPDFRDEAVDRLDEDMSAVAAVVAVTKDLAEIFTSSASEYLRARVADLNDIRNRVLDTLTGRERENLALGPEFILVADDFTPSMTASLTSANCGGLITTAGSYTSHASIFARNQGIPAITRCDISNPEELEGRLALLNAASGQLTVDPTPNERILFEEELALQNAAGQAQEEVRGRKVEGPYGKVALLANVGTLADARAAIELDAEGVGLFRTETIYLSANQIPSESEQFEIYSEAAALLAERPLIIRTLDIGADKHVGYLTQPAEPNPALGTRGIRLCLRRPDVFLPQLRALLRTCGEHDNVWVMLPMITSGHEVEQFRSLMEQQLADLVSTGQRAELPARIGVMIETPAAVHSLLEIAELVDFISIGTNDLVQYYFAIDRESPIFSEIVRNDRATMSLLAQIIRTARSVGLHVGVCGELAADPTHAAELVALGVDELSMSPPAILPARHHLLQTFDPTPSALTHREVK